MHPVTMPVTSLGLRVSAINRVRQTLPRQRPVTLMHQHIHLCVSAGKNRTLLKMLFLSILHPLAAPLAGAVAVCACAHLLVAL